jgi:ABC-2 type transport system ATP-binding protein
VAELVANTVGTGRELVLALDQRPTAPIAGATLSDDGRGLTARVRDVGDELEGLLQRVRAAGANVEDLEVHRPGLHAAFLHLTGKDLRE